MLKKIFIYSGFFILFFWWLYRKMYHPDETGVYQVPSIDVSVFDTIKGPAQGTSLKRMQPTSWINYAKGSTSRMAILLTDTNSSWLDLAHGLRAAGIPFLITQNYKAALQHKVVMIYPTISGRMMKREVLKAIAKHPRDGGVIIAFNVFSEGLLEVFGYKHAVASYDHYNLRFNRTAPENTYAGNNPEWLVKLGDKEKTIDPIGTYTFMGATDPPLAFYEDNNAAIITKKYAVGCTYCIGLDLGYLLHRTYNNYRISHDAVETGAFEPTADILLNLVKNIYMKQSNAVTLGSVPDNKKMALVLTHNVDSRNQLLQAMRFAAFEKGAGIRSTFFVQAKYISDSQGESFMRPHLVDILRTLKEWEMDIGSHTVSGNSRFQSLTIGTGIEQYPSYDPYVESKVKVYNATTLGEVRVSRFLLDKFGGPVTSFRPPNLRIPKLMPQLLQSCGYAYSSAFSSSLIFGHHPFRLNFDYGNDEEMNVFEFPITLDDEHIKGELSSQMANSIETAYKLSNFGGMMLVSLRTDSLKKLDFEKELVRSVKDFAWIGSLQEFGDFWTARDQVDAEIIDDTLYVNIPQRIKGLPIQIPKGLRMYNYDPPDLPIDQYDDKLLIYDYQGSAKIFLTDDPVSPRDTMVVANKRRLK